MKTATDWIQRLALQAHPEGGWYRETYRSSDLLQLEGLPARFEGPRVASTAIYYLLESGQFSALHRIRSDEVWHFYDGGPLDIHAIGLDGECHHWRLGRVGESSMPQVVVPAGFWFGARCAEGSAFSLCGCTVAPGFDFADFEMGDLHDLIASFPQHRALIDSLTRVEESPGS